MRKFLYLIVLLGLIISCKKQEVPTDESGVALLKAVTSLNTAESQKIAYSTLQDQERLSLWTEKLNSDIKSGNFSEKQIECILELQSLLTIDVFKKGKAKDIFNLITFPNWIKKNENVLTDAELYKIAFSFDLSPVQKKTLGSTVSNVMSDCVCAVGSQFTCYRVQPDGGNWGDCTLVGECAKSSHGCGALWDNECDGSRCSNKPVQPPIPPAPLP